jgi:hypothetical protein
MTMMMKGLRSAVLVGATLAALLNGSGTTTAQPGAEFQNQGIREDLGLPRFGEPQRRHLLRAAHIIRCSSYRHLHGCRAHRR